jgi:hypothetical protein
MIAVAAEIRAASLGSASVPLGEGGGHPSIARAIHGAIEAPEHVLVEREPGLIQPETSLVWDLLLGPRMRFLLGTALLVGFLLWLDQNGIVSGSQIKEVATRAIDHPDPVRALRDARVDVRVPAQTRPLRLPCLPALVANLFQGWGSGAAGLILILSALVPGPRMALFAIPGAAIALLGPVAGLPAMGPLDSSVASIAVGAGVAFLGVFLGRSRAG